MSKTGRVDQITEKKMVVGYIRVSTADQVREEQSLPRQREKIVDYCRLKGLSEPVIIEDQGISGFKENRSGFQRLINLCKSGCVRTVIVYDLSRLSRSVRTTLSFVEDLIQERGIGFVSLSQDIDTQTPHGKAFLTLISVFNQLYRDEIAYKTTIALKHKKQKGEIYGQVPYGYQAIDGKLVLDLTELQILKRIKSMHQSGMSSRQIASALELEGFKTKKGCSNWQSQTVLNLIKRSANDGA